MKLGYALLKIYKNFLLRLYFLCNMCYNYPKYTELYIFMKKEEIYYGY